MKNYIATIFASILLFSAATTVRAEDQVCVQSYGQPVVCGAQTPEFHALVKTGIADLNFAVLGGSLLIAAGVLSYYSTRKTSA